MPSTELFYATLITITILISLSIVWSTLISGISPMPSSKKARHAMLQLIEATGTETGPIFELGSGWGNLLIPLAKKYPHRQIVGFELSVVPWFMTVLLKNLFGLTNVQIYRKNFLQADLTSASVIVCYLYPEGMQKLAKKIGDQSGQTGYLVSNNFALPAHQPIKTLQLNDLYKSPVYLYQFTALP